MLSGLRNNDLVRSRPTRIRKLSHQATVQKSQSGKSHLDVANQTLRCASFLTEMQFLLPFRISVLITAICLCVQGQTTQSPDAQIEAKGIKAAVAEITELPSVTVPLPSDQAASPVNKLIDALEDHDDVKEVYSNAEFPEDLVRAAE